MTALPLPTPEQLALSASVFTNTIDSWIPAKFGPRTTDADREVEFAKRLRDAAAQGETNTLGLGHPDIGVYKPKGPSLSALEKKLGKVDRKGKAKETEEVASASKSREADSDDEAESRAMAVGKRKANLVHDLLGGKKKQKAKAINGGVIGSSEHPALLNLTPLGSARTPSPTGDDDGDREDLRPTTPLAASSPGGAGNFPFSGPLALTSPRAKRALLGKREHSDQDDEMAADDDTPPATNTGTPTKSKSAKRREAKKRAKLNKQLDAQA
jgi:hypothetical protein